VPWRAVLGIAALAAVLLGAAFARPSARRVAREPKASAVHATVEAPGSLHPRDRVNVNEAPWGPAPASVMSLPEEHALAATPLQGASYQPTSPAVRAPAKKRAARLRPARVVPANEGSSAAPAGPSNAKPALLTTWDW
jgi:hypothetical protein